MAIINELPHYEECEKLDPQCINAYLELTTDPLDAKKLVLESSWGETKVDMSPITKATETQTRLWLSPADAPVYLEYDGESGVPQCIYGDDLARIIPMTKLKDVDQDTPIANGYVYMYNSTKELFEPYDLLTFVNTTNSRLTSLEGRMTAAENAITALQAAVASLQIAVANLTNRVTIIEEILEKPAGVPADVRLVWGNRNVISDSSNTYNRSHGLYTHNPNTDLTDDLYFA